jgi:pyruvate dehydrogenase E2 component (dihydrolipoamide acetyltransferase)
MSFSVTMPALGESVTEGTVTRWLKNEGDRVEADEPLLEVSTDKVDTEIPSPAAGVLSSIKVQQDETVQVGVELAVIADGADSAAATPPAVAAVPPAPPAPPVQAAPPAPPVQAAPPAPPVQAAPPAPVVQAAPPAPVVQAAPPAPPVQAAPPAPVVQAAPPAPVVQAAPPAPPAPVASPANGTEPALAESDDAEETDDDVAGTYLTPLVRKLAAEHGVDLNSIQGTGVGGRIRKADVLAAIPVPTTAPAPSPAPAAVAASAGSPATAVGGPGASRDRVEKMSRIRQVIAARMVESLQTSAQLTTVVEVDVTLIGRLRDQAKRAFEEREGVKLTFLPFFAIATLEALKAHPVLNSSISVEDKTITYHDAEHLGIAVDTERGLAVPVIRDAGDLNLAGIARKIADLAERTRANKVSPDELGGGTFTITNTGSRGALFDTPIINQPQVAILGTGLIVKRPVVLSDPNIGETIAIRSMVYLALSYDHRIVDGADAARFLATIKTRLEAGDFSRELGLD